MSLLEHVDQLRRLAATAPDATALELAMLNVIEELAVAVEDLTGGDGTRFGTI
jgi:hypothetical protein